MKKTILTIFFLITFPSMAHDYHSSYIQNEKCYGNVYREKYIQGNARKPGYVRKWEETIRIPCEQHEIGIKKEIINRNDYQKTFKDNIKKLGKWINSKVADWKLEQSDNYIKEDN